MKLIFNYFSIAAFSMSFISLNAQEKKNMQFFYKDIDADKKTDTICFDYASSILRVKSVNTKTCRSYNCNFGVIPDNVEMVDYKIIISSFAPNFKGYSYLTFGFSAKGDNLRILKIEFEEMYNMIPEVPVKKCLKIFQKAKNVNKNLVMKEYEALTSDKVYDGCDCKIRYEKSFSSLKEFMDLYSEGIYDELAVIIFKEYLNKYPITKENYNQYSEFSKKLKKLHFNVEYKILKQVMTKTHS